MERKSAFIQLTIPVKMTYIVTQKYSKTAKERRKKKASPYYTNTSLYDKNGEPIFERDFEG